MSIISRPTGSPRRRRPRPLGLQRLVEHAPVADLGQRVGGRQSRQLLVEAVHLEQGGHLLGDVLEGAEQAHRPAVLHRRDALRPDPARVAPGGDEGQLQVPGRAVAGAGRDRGADRRLRIRRVEVDRVLQRRHRRRARARGCGRPARSSRGASSRGRAPSRRSAPSAPVCRSSSAERSICASVALRRVRSMCVPVMRTAMPNSSRSTTLPRLSSQTQWPFLCRTRNSHS